MDTIREAFAFNLKIKRGDKTQAEFAEFLGLPLRTYQKIEAGNIPQRATMKRLTQKLGVTEIELVQLPGKAATVAASEYVLDYTAKQNGSHIARIRRKMSMTQAELARRSGLTEDIIEGIEKGQDLPLTVATHLAAALDCGIPALIGEFEGPRRPNRNTQPGRRTQDAFAGLKDLFLVLAELSALNEPEVAANFVNSAIKDLRAMLAGYRGEPLPEEISTPKQRTSKG